MRGPFRYQASGGDCFPTTMLNALTALYPFPRLPSLVVQRVYQYTLDDVSLSGGTTDDAGRFLCGWLNSFRKGGITVNARFLSGPEVTLAPRGRIARHVAGGGVATLDVHSTEGARHSLLLLELDKDWAWFWDPRYRPRATRDARHVEVLRPSRPEEPNRRVRRDWLEKARTLPFAMGPVAKRSAILLSR
jgi:hypothetical protein